MRITMTHAAVAAIAAAFAVDGAARAQAQVDLNLGYTRFDDIDEDAFTGRLSARLLSNFGAEGEVSVGVGDDNGLDTAWGVFGKGAIPLGEVTELFARVGYVDAEADGGAGGDGVAFGAGGQFTITGRSGVRLDYTRYEFEDDVDSWSISYVLSLF
jgi:hypothetical protein